MYFDLPISIEINGNNHPIRKKGDYRVILDVLNALNDSELSEENRLKCALIIFYEDIYKIKDMQTAVEKMMVFLNNGEIETETDGCPRIMDWEHDFKIIVPSINRVFGKEIRTMEYLHWWTFLGGYMEIGESTFSTVISIRKKKQKGKKLDEWEKEFCRENKKMVDLPLKLTSEEQEFFDSEW